MSTIPLKHELDRRMQYVHRVCSIIDIWIYLCCSGQKKISELQETEPKTRIRNEKTMAKHTKDTHTAKQRKNGKRVSKHQK